MTRFLRTERSYFHTVPMVPNLMLSVVTLGGFIYFTQRTWGPSTSREGLFSVSAICIHSSPNQSAESLQECLLRDRAAARCCKNISSLIIFKPWQCLWALSMVALFQLGLCQHVPSSPSPILALQWGSGVQYPHWAPISDVCFPLLPLLCYFWLMEELCPSTMCSRMVNCAFCS